MSNTWFIRLFFKQKLFKVLYDDHPNMETVTISKEEYEKLKKLEKVDHELISQLVESLEDAKHGKIRRVA